MNFSSKSLSLCLQVENSSLRLLRVAPSGEKIMRYFSFKHNWQVFVTGLKTLPLVKTFHDNSYWMFSLFRLQMCPLRVVAFSSFVYIKFKCKTPYSTYQEPQSITADHLDPENSLTWGRRVAHRQGKACAHARPKRRGACRCTGLRCGCPSSGLVPCIYSIVTTSPMLNPPSSEPLPSYENKPLFPGGPPSAWTEIVNRNIPFVKIII